MKRLIILSVIIAFCFSSCEGFLEEEPVGLLTTNQFFNTPNQIQTAVDGAYTGMARPFTSVFLGLPISEFLSFSALPGFSTNPFGTGPDESSFVRLDPIDPGNGYLNHAFNTVYVPMENRGEHILMIQRQSNVANSEMHNAVLPPAIPSAGNIFESSLLPSIEFYNSYLAGDRRTEDGAYFYEYAPGSITTYKYWDELAAATPPSGANIPIFRYADLLLICAEAKANVDGGATSDPTAIEAYFQVRNRAFPNEPISASISVDEILKERIWELSFEYLITWFDLQRTRKTLDVQSGEMVNLIGHQATTHLRAFAETDLLLPMPNEQVNLNPRLAEPAP
ncbi:MAG: RagB/SusD family nutrient uptake outer membrane protein [Cyclobacteriaceae bacterium]